jgi:hypothetical protein
LTPGLHVELESQGHLEPYLRLDGIAHYLLRRNVIAFLLGTDQLQVPALNTGVLAGDAAMLRRVGSWWAECLETIRIARVPFAGLQVISFSVAVAAMREASPVVPECVPSCSDAPGLGRWNFDARRCRDCATFALGWSTHRCGDHDARIVHFIGPNKAAPSSEPLDIHRSDLLGRVRLSAGSGTRKRDVRKWRNG